MKPDLAVSFAGIKFKNPVTVASGTFGFGREYSQFIDLNQIGGICVKGLTAKPREGNPPPRIAETPMGILNSVGLQNPGVDEFIKSELPFLRKFDTRVIANISGNTVNEYAEMAEKLSDAGVDILEVNISCPNVKAGGLAFGTNSKSAASVTKAVRCSSKVPVMVKLSPNVTDISEIALACQDAGADGLSLINTLLGMKIDIDTGKPVFKNNIGGLSGPAIFPIALRMVWQVCSAVKIPVMGMGGISRGEDAIEMFFAGATLISVGTACFRNPLAPIQIKQEIEEYLIRKEKNSLNEIRNKLKIY